MSQPTPSKKPMPAAQPLPRDAQLSQGAQRQAVVRYYRRMRKERVYPLMVGFQATSGKRAVSELSGGSITLRPLVPGALVTPSELPCDSATSAGQATFYVTPLAKGQLPDARIQLHQQGHLIQEIGLPMRSVSQRKTWAWAALTVIVPLLLLHYGKYQRLTGTVPREIGGRTTEAQGNPGEVLEQRIKENIPTETRFDITGKAAYGIGWFYNNAICGVGMDAYLPFFAFLVLLLITFLSWVAHTSRKARRRGDPIALRA